MLIQVLQAAAIGYLPGAVAFRLPVADRARRAALEPAERLFWQVLLSLSISLSLVLALAAIGRYSFERLVGADLALAAAGALAARFRLRLGTPARRPGVAALVPLALLLLGVWRFFPSSEYVIGGKDPGTYMNEGIQIAQRGALAPVDPLIASVPPFARDLFFPSHQRSEYYSLRFMGFFIRDPDEGHVVGQFPHLFPASIALGYGLDGLSGARRTVGVWAVLGVLAVYFAGARLFGRMAAGAAAGLLAVHVIQVWFARYPNAEVVMQAMLFSALLASARAHVDGDRFFAPVAALLLGLLLFLRFDAVLGIAGVAGGLALVVLAGGKVRTSFLIVFGVAAVLAAAYLLGPMRAYAELPIVFLSNLRWWQYAAIAAGCLLIGIALALGARWPPVTSFVRSTAPGATAAVVCLAAVYALFLRQPGGKLTDYDAYALRTFTNVYFTVPGLIAALIGYALAARREFWRAPALFLTVAVFSLFFFYKVRIVPEHFWMARRFLPVILPGALLFAAAAALAGTRAGPRRARVLRGAIGGIFLVLLASQYVRAARPILEHVEYAGIIPKLEQLAAAVHDDDLLVVESRDASDTHVLALPLAYVYARNALVLASRAPDKASFALFLDWAHGRYRRVLFMGGGGTDLLSRRWAVRAVAGDRFQVPEYEVSAAGLPRSTRRKEFDYSIYEFVPAEPSSSDAPIDIDVGTRDDLNVLRFHAKEQSDGRTFRWSRGVSYLTLAALPETSREITLWMADGGRPDAAPPAAVTIALQYGAARDGSGASEQTLGTVNVTAGFKPYTLPIPAALAAAVARTNEPVRIRLASTVWVPEKVLGTPDDRDLGVMVDRVAVK